MMIYVSPREQPHAVVSEKEWEWRQGSVRGSCMRLQVNCLLNYLSSPKVIETRRRVN